MKSVITLIALFAICGLALPALEAKSDQESPELPTYKLEAFGTHLKAPIPVHVVNPQLNKEMVGLEIRMSFKISKNGNPHSIRHNAWPSDQEATRLGSIMQDCLRNWKFNPAVDKEGKAVAVKVNLPIRVVGNGDTTAESYARIILDEPVLVAVLDR